MSQNLYVDEAIVCLRLGLSLNKTAKALRVSQARLSRAIKEREPDAIQDAYKRFIPDSTKREAVKLHLAGVPAYKVAAELGVSESSVFRWACSGKYE